MACFQINGKNLILTGDPTTFAYTVKLNGAEWNMTEPPYVQFANGDKVLFPAPVSEETYVSGTAQGIKAKYEGFGAHGITVETKAEIETLTDDVYFVVKVENDERCEIDYVSFPAPFDYGAKYGDLPAQRENFLPESYTVLSFMQGELVPAGTQVKIDVGRVFERDAYMPIFGQVRGNTGYLAIYDTPYDARITFCYEDGEKVAGVWNPSLGYMAYPRKMLYRFMENCDYNDMAKSYRAYVKSRGRLVTLKEKFARNPEAAKLIGCPIVHEGIATHISPESDYYQPDKPEVNDNYIPFKVRAEQMKELYRKGVRKAYMHLDGWGNHGYDNLHPDPFPPHEASGGWDGMRELGETVNGLGFLFGIHDQYRDYYYDAPSFDFDNCVTYGDGSHPFCSVWYGGPHSWLCSALAPGYVRRNYETFKQMNIPIKGSYLDVFSVVFLDECFHADHPVTREQCAMYRRQCLDILTDRGIIPSSEEVLDCILPSQVLCHHTPFHCIGQEKCAGYPIPLLNLVYHDCVVIPWIGHKGTRGGWGIPKADNPYVHAWLNGDPTYLNITADEAEIEEVQAACAHAEKLAHEQIVKHEFLSADMRTQRTTFSDGTVVEVNFDTDEIIVK